MLSTLIKATLYIVITLAVVILSLEGFARLFLVNHRFESLVPKNIGQFDAELGWLLKPNAYGSSKRTGQLIEYRINSKGLRDDEVDYKKPNHIFRIVLLGDSNTFGAGVPVEKHLSTLLEGYFNNVEVVNMGVSGFGVDQVLLYLQSEGFKYQPDLVLVYVPHYSNHRHMHTKRWGKQKPRFIINDDELVLINSPVKHSGLMRYNRLREIDQWASRYIELYLVFRGVILNFMRRNINQVSYVEVQKEEDIVDDNFIKDLYRLGDLLIQRIYEESANKDITFVLATKVNELHEAMIAKGILSLNVSRALANDKFPLPDGLSHYNESGHGALAWEITRFLQDNQLIPEAHRRAQ